MTAGNGQGIQVDVEGPEDAPLAPAEVERVVRRVLEAEASEGEVSVAFLDDDGMRELNRRYLERDRPTDVLAFRLGGPWDGGLVGDVYVGRERAMDQACQHEVSHREELVRLVIHGVLHVVGHDHPDGPERDASPMFRRQEALVREALEALGDRSAPGSTDSEGDPVG